MLGGVFTVETDDHLMHPDYVDAGVLIDLADSRNPFRWYTL